MTLAVIEAEAPAIPDASPQSNPAVFTVDGKSFADTVKLIGRAAGRGSGMFTPRILFAFKDQRVVIGATDFEVALISKLPVKGKRAATVALDAGPIIAFAKALGDGPVEVSVTPEQVILVSGDLTYSIRPLLDVPAIPVAAAVDPQPLDVAAFVRAVTIAGSCASTDDARPILTGILFRADGVAVATDSYRIAAVEGAPTGIDALVPASGAKLASAVLAGLDPDDVTFEKVDGRLIIRSASTVFSTRLIDGDFPNWERLMRPHDQDVQTAVVNRQQLLEATVKVTVARCDVSPVRVTSTGDVLRLAMRSVDGPTGDADLPFTGGGEIGFAFNPDYLAGLVKAVGCDTLRLGLVDNIKPINITDPSDPSWKMLLMPVLV